MNVSKQRATNIKELRLHETVIKRLYLYERKTITNYCPVNCLDLDIVVLRQFTGQ